MWMARVDRCRRGSFVQRAVTVSAAGLLCLFSGQVWAAAPTEQLKGSIEQVIRILEDPKLKQESMAAVRRAEIRKQAEAIFDFTETGKRALGQHWQSLNDSQRQEFISLFTDLLERSYITRIEQYSGEQIVYAGESIEGDTATVRTKFVTKQGTEVPVDYRLIRRGDRWLAYDVLIEGISLVSNYRTQFDRIMRTASYPELARRMRAHQSEFGAPGSPSARPPRS
jgi:phospholipid transport system substrate-binding protein